MASTRTLVVCEKGILSPIARGRVDEVAWANATFAAPPSSRARATTEDLVTMPPPEFARSVSGVGQNFRWCLSQW